MILSLNKFTGKSYVKLAIQACAFYFASVIYQANINVPLSLDMTFWQFRDLFVFWSLSVVVVHSAVCGITAETRFWAFFLLGIIAFEGEVWAYVMPYVDNWQQFLLVPVTINLIVYLIYKYYPVIAHCLSRLLFKMSGKSYLRDSFHDIGMSLKTGPIRSRKLSSMFREASHASVTAEIGHFLVRMSRPSFIRLNMLRMQKYFLTFEVFWVFVIIGYYFIFGDMDGNLTAQWKALGHVDLFAMAYVISDTIGLYSVFMLVINLYREKAGISQLSLTPSEESLIDAEYERMLAESK